MQRAPIALVAATGLSGSLAFGLVETPFTPQAQALFLVFGALLATMLAGKMFLGGGHSHSAGHGVAHARRAHGHSRGHGRSHGREGAILFSGRAVGTMMVAAGALALVSFWTDNELSAQKIGRHIDGGVASLSRHVQATVGVLSDGGTAEEEAAQN